MSTRQYSRPNDRRPASGSTLQQQRSASKLNEAITPSSSAGKNNAATPTPPPMAATPPNSELMDLLMDTSFERAVSSVAHTDSSWLVTEGDDLIGNNDDNNASLPVDNDLPELPGEEQPQPTTSAPASRKSSFSQSQQPSPAAAPVVDVEPQPAPQKLGFFARLLRFLACKVDNEPKPSAAPVRKKPRNTRPDTETPRLVMDSARSQKSTARTFVSATSSPGKPPLHPSSYTATEPIPEHTTATNGPVPSLPLHKIQSGGKAPQQPQGQADTYRTQDTSLTDLNSPLSGDDTNRNGASNNNDNGLLNLDEEDDDFGDLPSGRSMTLDYSLEDSLGFAMSQDASTADWLLHQDAGNELEDLEATLSSPLSVKNH